MNKRELWDDIRRSVEGDAWHGPSVNESLKNITADRAARRLAPGVHSIWELTLHVAAWMDEVAERLNGRYHAEPLAGNFVTPADCSPAAWSAATAAVTAALDRLSAALDALPESRLGALVRPGLTHARMLAGVAQHNAYHAGQIALLNKLRD